MDSPPLRPVLSLVIRSRGVPRPRNATLHPEEFSDQRFCGLEVLAVIGHIDPRAARDQHAADLGQRLGSNNAAFLLPTTRPGIRKINVPSGRERTRQHFLTARNSALFDT